MNANAKMSFDRFMKLVDAFLINRFGITHDDLVDIDYYSYWEDGRKPESAARKAIKESGGLE